MNLDKKSVMGFSFLKADPVYKMDLVLLDCFLSVCLQYSLLQIFCVRLYVLENGFNPIALEMAKTQ